MEKVRSFWNEISFYLKQPDMRLFWIFLVIALLITAAAFFYLSGYLTLVILGIFLEIGVIIFINNLKLAKANFSIKFEKKQLEAIVAGLYDGVIAYDPNFRIMMFNRTAEIIFSVKKEEIQGKEFTPQFAQNQRFTRLAQVMFPSLAPVMVTRSEAGVSPQVADISFSDPTMEVRVTTVKMTDEYGRLLGFTKIIKDRTREIEAAKSKNEFVTLAAHQLRTPLSAVSWTFEILEDENGLSDNIKELIKNGRQATGKLLKTVNDLLDVARIEEGRFGYTMENVEFITFIENLLAQRMIIAKQYGIKIYLERPEEKSIVLKIDKRKMAMALDNILDNALKYNVKNGEVVVKLKRLESEPFVTIGVTDTGIGIPGEEMPKLFTKFFRATNVVKFQTEGTGLGLYISRSIIRQHGGNISAESTLNRGTTFTISLPTDPNLVPIREVLAE